MRGDGRGGDHPEAPLPRPRVLVTRGRAVVAVAGAALLVTSFVPLWATYRVPGLGLVAPQTVHQNAWAAYGLTMQIALALAVAAVVVAVVPAAARQGFALLTLCAAATVLLGWQVARGPRGSHDPGGYGIERGLLVFTGAALGAAMTYGGYIAFKETAPPGPVRG